MNLFGTAASYLAESERRGKETDHCEFDRFRLTLSAAQHEEDVGCRNLRVRSSSSFISPPPWY